MATILATFGSGGAGLTPSGSSGSPSLATILRDIADDLGGTRISAAVAAPNASDLATAITLVNEIKTKLNAARAYSLLTIKG